MGISPKLFKSLVAAANEKNCVIMIRKTNKGSVTYFDTETGVGKKLPTKGKSSEAYFTNGSIPFFADMAKKVGNWFYEQTNLIEVTTININEKEGRPTAPKYTYIPKLVALNDELLTPIANKVDVEEIPSGGKKVTVHQDKLGGTSQKVSYYLKKVKFTDVKTINGQDTRLPWFLENDTDECYQVYIFKADIEKLSIGNISAAQYIGEVPTSVSETNKFDRSNFWSTLWKNRKVENSNLGKIAGTNSPLDTFGATITIESEAYYAVNVLALLTQGKAIDKEGSKSASNTPKMYFEVVADYDNFMIAPNLKMHFIDPFLQERQTPRTIGRQPKMNRDKLLMNLDKLWDTTSWKIQDNFIPKSDTGIAHYGIYSEYEKEVRKEMNQQIGVKAVQHGCEVANLFFTSDIFEPLILILPSKNADITKQLFFIDLKMLFRLIKVNTTDRRIEETISVSRDTQWSIKYTIHSGFSLGNQFAFIFNLNWGGTDFYYNKTKPGDKTIEVWKREKENEFNNLIQWLESYVINDIELAENDHSVQARTDHDFYKIFTEYSTKQFPIKALSLFLYELYKTVCTFDAHEVASVFGIRRRVTHYSFIKELMYMSEYYMAVYTSADQFASIVHITDPTEISAVKAQYVEAVKAINCIGQKYLTNFLPERISSNTSTSLRGRARFVAFSHALTHDPYKLGGRFGAFGKAIQAWIGEMETFLATPPPTVQ